MTETRKIFTLKQVATSIQKVISERYTSTYWVQAEMHKLNYTNKGHCYPELVQKDEGKTVAEMRGTIWKFNFDRIQKQFTTVVKEPLRDGMSLLFLVKISYHPLYGMGLEIVDIDPTFALGELQKERQETLNRLTNEGILNLNQRLKFPLLPQRIAIISVDSSKGLSDFYSIIQNNGWNYAYFFMLFTAQLNGDAAIESIQQQLQKIEKVKHHFDAVAIIRGGGGEIGLSCYNNYQLAKAIATFPLPVLTGIGHSTNITVCELVSFRNSITPTELADFLLQCFHNFAVPLKDAQRVVVQESKLILQQEKEALKQESRAFKLLTQRMIQENKQQIQAISKQTHMYIHFRFLSEMNVIQGMMQKIQKESKTLKLKAEESIHQQSNWMQKCLNQFLRTQVNWVEDHAFFLQKQAPKQIQRSQEELLQLEKTIRFLDPIHVLKRGYSITRFEGKTIQKSTKINPGSTIEITTFDQEISATIQEIKTNSHE